MSEAVGGLLEDFIARACKVNEVVVQGTFASGVRYHVIRSALRQTPWGT
jgi:hypothetical protein